MPSLFELIALLLTAAAALSWVNRRFLGMPRSIGLLVMAIAAAGLLLLADAAWPRAHLLRQLRETLSRVTFDALVMDGLLAFLLFAGALQVDLGALRRRALQVFALAFVGTILSTAVVGLGAWAVARALELPVTLPWALVFGALISPTDPVAVSSTLRQVALPESLETELQGESLLNDGIGIVLFLVALRFATHAGGTDAAAVARLLATEALGGVALGVATGGIAYLAMRTVDDPPVEILVSLALVTATYALASRLALSGPLATVAAGLLIGEKAPRDALSDTSRRVVFGFWATIDEVLNALLFLLIGVEVLVIGFEGVSPTFALAAIPIALLARLVAVSVPLPFLAGLGGVSVRNVPLLTWAGVRGGVSIALALSLPEGAAKPDLLAATYAVAIFTIVVQGLTLPAVARRTVPGLGRA